MGSQSRTRLSGFYMFRLQRLSQVLLLAAVGGAATGGGSRRVGWSQEHLACSGPWPRPARSGEPAAPSLTPAPLF